MDLHLHIRFHTHWGQQLYVCGNIPELGNGELAKAVPMAYLDNETWHLKIKIKSQPEQIQYNYLLRDDRGSETVEWGNDRILSTAGKRVRMIKTIDTWNHAGDIANAFLTAPFQKVLLQGGQMSDKKGGEKPCTHIFKVKAPLLQQHEVLCMLGRNPSLGGWSTEKPLLLQKEENAWWTLEIDLSKETFPITYKYGVYHTQEKKFRYFEAGTDRWLKDQCKAGQLTVVADGFARFDYTAWKGAGLSIPVFSIRTQQSFGVGEFSDMKLLVDWAREMGLKLVQILPVNDTTATHTWIDSYPYAAISAFALHPLYVSLSGIGKLEASHPLQKAYKKTQQTLNALPAVEYEQVLRFKLAYLKALFAARQETFLAEEDFQQFYQENEHWLKPYAAFCYLRDLYGTSDFNQWQQYNVYDPAEIDQLCSPRQKHYADIAVHYFIQYHLHRQLSEAVQYAHKQGVVVKGDIPIGIYRYGVDAWVAPELYNMDAQAGAPPDDFAIKGQNWGFPTYNWERMEQDGFDWWKKRFHQMSNYFDTFRIDHILGFFRIWQIPIHAVEGIMGYFNPAIPVGIQEFADRGIWFDRARFCQPYITEELLKELFGREAQWVKEQFLEVTEKGRWQLKAAYTTQRQIAQYAKEQAAKGQPLSDHLRQGLYDLLSNVLFFEVEGSNGTQFHPRYAMEHTHAFRDLDLHTQQQLRELYIDYFWKRQNEFWRSQALRRLPAIKRATNMLICGEDLGMVPACVPGVMKDLGILSLEIQRMPKEPGTEFFHPKNAPYLSVITPATHDMSTIRGWWEEDRHRTQRFYNYLLGHYGEAPHCCEAWIVKEIVLQHLYSPAMWSIFQVQDLLGMNEKLRRENPHEERINVPAISPYYWRYRMHLYLEELLEEKMFNREFRNYIEHAGRA